MGLLVGLGKHLQLGDEIALGPPGVGRAQGVVPVDARRGEGVIVTLMREELVGPGADEDVDGLFEELAVGLGVGGVGLGVEDGTLPGTDTSANGHVDAALGHLVQHSDVLGEADGVPVGQEVGALAESDAACAAGEVGAQQDGVGKLVHTLGAHVVLADPGGVETGLLAEDDFLSKVVEELVVVSVAAGVNAGVEVSEFHGVLSVVVGLWGRVWGSISERALLTASQDCAPFLYTLREVTVSQYICRRSSCPYPRSWDPHRRNSFRRASGFCKRIG